MGNHTNANMSIYYKDSLKPSLTSSSKLPFLVQDPNCYIVHSTHVCEFPWQCAQPTSNVTRESLVCPYWPTLAVTPPFIPSHQNHPQKPSFNIFQSIAAIEDVLNTFLPIFSSPLPPLNLASWTIAPTHCGHITQ